MRSLVVGVGNLLCTDDGVGIHVVERLDALHRGVETIDAAMGSIEIIEAMRGYDRAIIVDAIQTGADPGDIHMVNLAAGEKPPRLIHSHGTDILTTIQLGYRLYAGEMPREAMRAGSRSTRTWRRAPPMIWVSATRGTCLTASSSWAARRRSVKWS